MSETLKKINIYIRPELTIVAKQAATSEGLSLSAWFRKRAHEELALSVELQTSATPCATGINSRVKCP